MPVTLSPFLKDDLPSSVRRRPQAWGRAPLNLLRRWARLPERAPPAVIPPSAEGTAPTEAAHGTNQYRQAHGHAGRIAQGRVRPPADRDAVAVDLGGRDRLPRADGPPARGPAGTPPR